MNVIRLSFVIVIFIIFLFLLFFLIMLVNCLYYLIHSKRYGVEISNLGASHETQNHLVHVIKGKGVAWLLRQLGQIAPVQTGVIEPIDRATILSFQHDNIIDDRWMFHVWVFHKIFDELPIYILTHTNSLRYSFEQGEIHEGPRGSDDTNYLKNGCVLRLSPAEGIPIEVESLYYK